MNETQTKNRSLQEADALIIALKSRRFVIVRKNESQKLYPAEPICKRIRDLQPGDEVYYQGTLDTVCGLSAY